MGYKFNSSLAALFIIVFYIFQRQHRRDAVARKQGCELPVKHRPLEPFTGFDFQMSVYMDFPSLYRHHQQYGKSFQVSSLLGSPTINTIATENIRIINSGKDWGIEPMRLAGMEYFCGRGFITTDGYTWQHSRKLLKPAFSKQNLVDLSTLSIEVDSFLKQIPSDGATVDIQPLLYSMFLNSSLHFLLGINLRNNLSGAPSTSDEFIKAFHDALFFTMLKLMLGPAFKLIPQAKYLKACEIAHHFLDYYVDQALSETTTSLDTNSNDAEPNHKESVIQGLSSQTQDRNSIRSQIIQGMMASQETTSELLGNTLFLLARHPIYWEQIRTEALRNGNKLLEFDALLHSKALQNTLLEALRLYPIFPNMARVSLCDTKLPVGGGPNQDLPIFAPKGTQVIMSYYALHRDPAVFGDDVEAFKPERWDYISPGQWDFMGFGGGNRACLGKQKVLAEASYVLVRMASAFEKLESSDDQDWKGELKITCKSANGCKVALS